MRHVERAKPHLRPGEEDRVYPPPQFIIPLQNVQQVEGGKVHMEARIEPVGDPSMVVEWFLNGQPLAASKSKDSFHLPRLRNILFINALLFVFLFRFPRHFRFQIRFYCPRFIEHYDS